MSGAPTSPPRAGSGKWPEPAEAAQAALFLSSGLALIAHILFDLPLAVAWLMLVTCLAALVWFATARSGARMLPGPAVLRAGLLASGCGLLAYDASRTLLYVSGVAAEPFKALPFFGAGLLGTGAPAAAQVAAGTAFHIVNGFAFGLAYTVVLGRRGVWFGIAWGVGLETAMLMLYPAWLEIHAFVPFVAMSLFGHLCYGAALGYVARRLLRRAHA